MTWVIRAGLWGQPDDPEYLHAFAYGAHGIDGDKVQWTKDQGLAFRFEDRNAAAGLCTRMHIGSYDEHVKPVKLVRRSTSAPTAKGEP